MAGFDWNEQPTIDEIEDFDEEVFVPLLHEVISKPSTKKRNGMQWIFIDTMDIRHSKAFNRIYFLHPDEGSNVVNRIMSRLKNNGGRSHSRGVIKISKDDLLSLHKKKKSD